MEEFDPIAILAEPVPVPVSDPDSNGYGDGGKRELVLGRNVHTSCLAVTEPDADDDVTGDKDAYMAGVLARYRKTLIERTKHHLGPSPFPFVACLLWIRFSWRIYL